jgi:hypothetical protein
MSELLDLALQAHGGLEGRLTPDELARKMEEVAAR